MVGQRLSTTHQRRALSERNKTYVMLLCSPLTVLLWQLPIHLAMLLGEGLLLMVIQRKLSLWRRVYLPVPVALWRSRRAILWLRKQIHDSRRITLRRWLSVFKPWPHKLTMLLKFGLPEVR